MFKILFYGIIIIIHDQLWCNIGKHLTLYPERLTLFDSEWVTETWEARNPNGSCGGRFVIYAEISGCVFMTNHLQKKPFLDYLAQIKYLKQKQLVINDEDSAAAVLEKVSYYSLINGYKDIFIAYFSSIPKSVQYIFYRKYHKMKKSFLS